MAALYDAADLLARCKRHAARPSSDEAMADTDWYALMTEAQAEWIPQIAAIAPDNMYGALTLMTTADSGLTYTFGTASDGASGTPAIEPLGHVEIRASKKSAPLTPGTDFWQEASGIRFPGGMARTTFVDGAPYARFVSPPKAIAASGSEPIVKPAFARMLLVYSAVSYFGDRGGLRPDLALRYEEKAQRFWMERVVPALKTKWYGAGDDAADTAGVWWYSPDLGGRAY